MTDTYLDTYLDTHQRLRLMHNMAHMGGPLS